MRRIYVIATAIYVILMSISLFFLDGWVYQEKLAFYITIAYYLISIVEFISIIKSQDYDVRVPIFHILFLNVILKAISL